MTDRSIALRRTFVRFLNAALPHTPNCDWLVGLPGFYSNHRRLPRSTDHPQAWISDILFSRACSDDWTPLQRRCTDKATAADVARSAAPELHFARRHAVLDVPDGASLADLKRMLAPFLGLPVVAKPAHSSGGILFLEEESTASEWHAFHERAVRDYYDISRERLYRGLPKRIVVEERLGKRPHVLVDCKFFCSKGNVFAVRISNDLLTNPKRMLYGLPGCELLHYSLPIPKRSRYFLTYQESVEAIQTLEHLDQMIMFAAKLSEPFDFVRVDFYDLSDGPCFGEYTFLESAGRIPVPSIELSDRLVRAVRDQASARLSSGKHA